MLDKVQADRQAKLEKIQALGIDPYGGRYDTAEAISSVLARYTDGVAGQQGDAAGRLVLYRDMGKMIFAHIRDQGGSMQIALRKNALDERSWALAKLLDLGDIVAASGPLERTKTGEITIWADKLTLLAKSLLPMPEKFHGLQDTETRYRQRYLDLMANPESMANFMKRVAIIDSFRAILNRRGFIEVETPVLQPIYGGAAARPFTTHHNTLDADLFMRISPELYLKRLLVGGMQRVYEFSRNFRNEGIDTRHNPEFTLLELYQAYGDYEVMMEITEELISTAAREVAGGTRLPYGEMELDFTPPWSRRKYADLLKECAGVEMRDSAAVRAKARELGIEEGNKDDAVVINAVFEATVEPALAKLNHPTFVIDYPAEICPLTRRKADDPSIAMRFEAFVAGMELGNAYTELNDPAVQEANFRQQVRGEADGETMRVMDEDFVTALRHGMPPAGGLGIGIDRVVMLLTNTTSIRDVILFPLLRPQVGASE
ncbi:MAG: lysine--tRNA ligase [Phycisphaerae bacterium]|jgi:lysyl-tRNA synthetase class 2